MFQSCSAVHCKHRFKRYGWSICWRNTKAPCLRVSFCEARITLNLYIVIRRNFWWIFNVLWLLNRDTLDVVKQSAALCLLRLFRTEPNVIPGGEWTTRIIHLLNDQVGLLVQLNIYQYNIWYILIFLQEKMTSYIWLICISTFSTWEW